jgi:hypothetical protein
MHAVIELLTKIFVKKKLAQMLYLDTLCDYDRNIDKIHGYNNAMMRN